MSCSVCMAASPIVMPIEALSSSPPRPMSCQIIDVLSGNAISDQTRAADVTVGDARDPKRA